MERITTENKIAPKYAEVVLDLAIDKILEYSIPEDLVISLEVGSRVEVPIRNRKSKGYIIKIKSEKDYPRKVSPISALLSDGPIIKPDLFQLALWMSRYYFSPLQYVFKKMLPAPVRDGAEAKKQLFVQRSKSIEELSEICILLRNKNSSQANVLDAMLKVKKGILLSELLEQASVSRSPVETLAKKGYLKITNIIIERSPLMDQDYFISKPKKLNEEQEQALDQINSNIENDKFATHLLYGVTGSGKTEVYLQAIQKALDKGKTSIMLVPEISLTAQTIERFKSRFPQDMAILHHRLSKGERLDEWRKIEDGRAKIVVGARSAIFSPLNNLGLIIIDEEHDNSYKQEDDTPCYHAREVAIMRAKQINGVVILGSATPALESYYNAQKGKYVLNRLGYRADSAQVPNIKIIDMRQEIAKTKNPFFSERLLNGIEERYKKGEQTILFLNRRGYHTTQICLSCSHVVECPNCDTSLTFHYNENKLSCHLCGYSILPPQNCPSCKSTQSMKFKGFGTEKVERTLHAIFPEIESVRLDGDTTKHKGSHQKLLQTFKNGRADVLIGTQMIAKGLHFPEVTLVGILNSDSALNIPDFRASENTFQLITQVSGRSGRGALSGEVLIQTFMPDNETIQQAALGNCDKFFEDELAIRKIFEYPPFNQIVKISFSGIKKDRVFTNAQSFRQQLISRLPKGYHVHPCIPSGHARINNKFRFQFLIKGANIYTINNAINKTKEKSILNNSVRMFINISPLSTYF